MTTPPCTTTFPARPSWARHSFSAMPRASSMHWITISAMETPAAAKLRAYANLYLGVLRDQRMCLCGMLAAEYQTLPEPMRNTRGPLL